MSETFGYNREFSIHSVSIHSDPETISQTSDDCDKTFHPFLHRPAELRDDIWKKALPGKGCYTIQRKSACRFKRVSLTCLKYDY